MVSEADSETEIKLKLKSIILFSEAERYNQSSTPPSDPKPQTRRSNKQSKTNKDDLFDAIKSEDVDRVRELLKQQPSLVKFHGYYHNSPCYHAFKQGNEMIIDLVTDTHEREYDVSSTLYMVAWCIGAVGWDTLEDTLNKEQTNVTLDRHLHRLCELLHRGADVNWKNEHGNSPLNCNTHPSIVDYLLQHGADADMKNNKGQTPLQRIEEEIKYWENRLRNADEGSRLHKYVTLILSQYKDCKRWLQQHKS